MNRRRILVIEDDPAIREGLVDALRAAGYDTIEAADGLDGLSAALGSTCDLLLLDLVLPGLDGVEILRRLKRDRPALPVIVLTARGVEQDRVTGLQLGADDYVVKPFSLRELLARIEAVLRRSPSASACAGVVRFPAGEADLTSGEIRYADGQTAALADREAALLRYLWVNEGRAVSRGELLARVWGIGAADIETRTVDMHIARLREKIRDVAPGGAVVQTVRGQGYRLIPGSER